MKDINQTKKRYIELLRSTGRKNIEELISYLENETDFFIAPASTKFHCNYMGGLAEHSLNVYDNFKKLLEMKEIPFEEDSIIICALLHDLCKCNNYVRETRNRKVNGQWESYEIWANAKRVDFPLPHSARSVRIIRNHIPLRFTEELTIFYHMGPYGGEDFEYRNMLKQVNTEYPFTTLFYIADLISSYLDEETVE